MLKFLQLNVVGALLVLVVAVSGRADDSELASPYVPSENVMADVDAALARAKENDKLVLIVMGATWCHDSRGLARRFADPTIASVVNDSYETLYVDVGYLDSARAVNQRFGMPSIYATPTVMIVDPETGALKNSKTMHIWRNADSISYGDTRSYFAEEAVKARAPEGDVSPLLQAYYAKIDAFEAAQAQRLVTGYDLIGPQLAMGPGKYPDGFEKLWGEVRGFRYQLTDDLLALRASAETLAAEGIDEELTFPEYPGLSWEGE
ncbi:thioredoxin family protein [Kordiimonas aquimaris]|uniref:thioredoxin family protein n=1 Tax=Kordiimonas aquimaris TaxID=707591 RepID=UPI0021D11091|nr:thioredoxin family protein [Kordiimonas aquimaris]